MLFAGSLLILPFACSVGADTEIQRRAAAVLLNRYETVVSARSRVLSQLHPGNPNQEIGSKSLSLAFIYLMAGLKAVGPNTLSAVEGGSDVVLTGAKDFTAPEGLGGVSYRTCQIAILTVGAEPTIAHEFSKVEAAPLDGRMVWTWSVPPSDGYRTPTNFYAAVVTSSLFVLTNNRDDFRDVANALTKGTAPTDLPGGRDLTALRTHGYWAYRAIRRPEGVDTLASGLRGLPASAVALELFTEYDDGKLFFSILVPDDRSGAAPTGLPSSESIHFQRAGPGLWQAAIDLNALTPRQKTAAVFQLMSHFGYGVFL
jgi:hypothetical protein